MGGGTLVLVPDTAQSGGEHLNSVRALFEEPLATVREFPLHVASATCRSLPVGCK